MAISFHCKCGRRLKVADAMAGRAGRCPSCGVGLTVPDSSDPYEVVRFDDQKPDRPCPSCRKPMSSAALVCVHCGYHRVAGSRIATLEEEERETPGGWRLRLFGQRVPIWLLVLVLALTAAVATWFYRGPAQPLLVTGKDYVHVTTAFAGGHTLQDGAYTVGGDDALVVVAPDEAGDHLLLNVALKQSVIRDHGQTAGYNSVINDQQFKLQPADGSPPLPVRVLATPFDSQATVDFARGNAGDYHALLPPVPPTEIKVDAARGFTQGAARWLVPQAMGDVQFSTVTGLGGTSSGGAVSARGNVQLADPANHVIDLNYTGHALVVSWPSDCTGWWSRTQWTKPSRSDGWYRHRFALLVDRPPSGGNHTLLYCDQPIATIRTSDPPPPRPLAASPLKPTTPQQHAQGQAAANNPLNYFSSLTRARQRARGLVAASNINQFSIAIQMFVDDRRRFPQSLLELVDANPELKQVLANPRTGDLPGYIYEPPPPGSPPHDTPILWESLAGQKDPDGAILYADFHLE